MRAEWVPLSAAALVTGVMALVLGQMINPGGNAVTPTDQLLVAADYPGRWLAMSVLFFLGAALLVLGLPSVLVHFQGRRGRGLGLVGSGVFIVGCVGVGGLAALMLMFRALALSALSTEEIRPAEASLVTRALDDQALVVMLGLWVYGFMAGVLLIAFGLLRAGVTPVWVPVLLLGFMAAQVVIPILEEGSAPARVASALGLILLAAGFTGIATNAVSPRVDGTLTRSLV